MHASEEARKIAEEGMILRVQMGSEVHATGSRRMAGLHAYAPRSPQALLTAGEFGVRPVGDGAEHAARGGQVLRRQVAP